MTDAAMTDAAMTQTAVSVAAAASRRLQTLDPLLPPLAPMPAGCGAELTVYDEAGELLAVGTCEHWSGAPESLELTWGAARQFRLSAHVAGPAGPGVTAALDRLLDGWRDHLAGLPDCAAADTAAAVTWPSRDVDGAAALLRHGFAPYAAIAIRARGGRPAGGAATSAAATTGAAARGTAVDASAAGGTAAGASAAPELAIRRATPDDLDALVELGLGVVRFDAYFSGVRERPWTASALRDEFAGMLAAPRPWMWLAERDGEPIGMLAAEPPEQAAWIAPMTRSDPVAYLLLAGVRPDDRARGTGAALAAALAAEADAADVPAILLHYAQVNPLSVPFWSQQGYRPLWTVWEAHPPASLR
jgi:GNAT superfamily N-acetyltransferase